MVDQALQLARLWRRLAELRTWRPLADTEDGARNPAIIGLPRLSAEAEIEDWLAIVDRRTRAAAYPCGACGARLDEPARRRTAHPGGMFLAACSVAAENRAGRFPCPSGRHRKPVITGAICISGCDWLAEFLDCVAAAAKVGLDELERLRRAEEKSRSLGRTARSRLPDAADAVLRAPIVTARDLAERST